MTDERGRDPTGDIRRMYAEAESRTAQAFEEVVSRGSFGELLARMTENIVAITKISTDTFDLVLRNLRLAGRQDVTRLARHLNRTEDKLELVLQEVERVQEELARRGSGPPGDARDRTAIRGRNELTHRNPSIRRWVALVAALVALAAVAVAVPTAGAARHAARAAEVLPYQNPVLPVSQRVDDLLSRMTLAEKVGQMTQTERYQVYNDPSPITTYALGSILSGGGSVPTPNTPTAWADMVDRFQRAALDSRLHIPILYGIDAVHGDNNMYGATVFPHNIGLGATRDPALVRNVEHVTAEETRASGPQWVFAPCLCAARDDRWGRTYESFGEDPSLVQTMETAIDGFQGSPGQLANRDRVLATAKHFAGDGNTTYGTGGNGYPIDQGIDITNHQDFWNTSLRQYVPAIHEHHVGSVMPSYSSVQWTDSGNGQPIKMHGNRDLIQGWLKDQQGFSGIVISDWEGIHQLPGDWATQVATGVNAGIDMMMEPNQYKSFISTLIQDVQDGRVPMARIDDAVRRILTKKFELGLFEHPFTDRTNLPQIGSPAHHALARRAAAESAVLLQNNRNTLPIHGNRDIYVAGSNADNVGNQAGGWTLTWQGGSGSFHKIPGTTILDGIRQLARGNVTYSQDASAPIPSRAVGIVVVGETPYAEGFGDVGGPQWAYDPDDTGPRPPKTMQFSAADNQAINRVCSQAKRCVVVVVSGRPMIIDPAQLRQMDALVAAWLPGSEGAGIADDLFGARAFTGLLPVSWPRSLSQEPINIGDPHYDPLFPFGYGLRTRAR